MDKFETVRKFIQGYIETHGTEQVAKEIKELQGKKVYIVDLNYTNF